MEDPLPDPHPPSGVETPSPRWGRSQIHWLL